MDGLGRLRIPFCQHGIEGFPSLLLRDLLQSLPIGMIPRSLIEFIALQKRLHIKSRAARKDRDPAPAVNLMDQCLRPLFELRYIEMSRGRQDSRPLMTSM